MPELLPEENEKKVLLALQVAREGFCQLSGPQMVFEQFVEGIGKAQMAVLSLAGQRVHTPVPEPEEAPVGPSELEVVDGEA